MQSPQALVDIGVNLTQKTAGVQSITDATGVSTWVAGKKVYDKAERMASQLQIMNEKIVDRAETFNSSSPSSSNSSDPVGLQSLLLAKHYTQSTVALVIDYINCQDSKYSFTFSPMD